MKNKKRLLSFVLAFMMVLGFMTPKAFAADTTTAAGRLEIMQGYMAQMRAQIATIKNAPDADSVDKAAMITLETRLGALLVSTSIPETGTKVTIWVKNSWGINLPKQVEVTDVAYTDKINALVTMDKVNQFASLAAEVNNTIINYETKKKELVDSANRVNISTQIGIAEGQIGTIDLALLTVTDKSYVDSQLVTFEALKAEKDAVKAISTSTLEGKDLVDLLERVNTLNTNLTTLLNEVKDIALAMQADNVKKVQIGAKVAEIVANIAIAQPLIDQIDGIVDFEAEKAEVTRLQGEVAIIGTSLVNAKGAELDELLVRVTSDVELSKAIADKAQTEYNRIKAEFEASVQTSIDELVATKAEIEKFIAEKTAIGDMVVTTVNDKEILTYINEAITSLQGILVSDGSFREELKYYNEIMATVNSAIQKFRDANKDLQAVAKELEAYVTNVTSLSNRTIALVNRYGTTYTNAVKELLPQVVTMLQSGANTQQVINMVVKAVKANWTLVPAVLETTLLVKDIEKAVKDGENLVADIEDAYNRTPGSREAMKVQIQNKINKQLAALTAEANAKIDASKIKAKEDAKKIVDRLLENILGNLNR